MWELDIGAEEVAGIAMQCSQYFAQGMKVAAQVRYAALQLMNAFQGGRIRPAENLVF